MIEVLNGLKLGTISKTLKKKKRKKKNASNLVSLRGLVKTAEAVQNIKTSDES